MGGGNIGKKKEWEKFMNLEMYDRGMKREEFWKEKKKMKGRKIERKKREVLRERIVERRKKGKEKSID